VCERYLKKAIVQQWFKVGAERSYVGCLGMKLGRDKSNRAAAKSWEGEGIDYCQNIQGRQEQKGLLYSSLQA
jgi:hypothetical protein